MNRNSKVTFSVVVILFFTFLAFGSMDDSSHKSGSSFEPSASKIKDYKKTGDVLSTHYFDVTVNSARIQNRVNTGNEFADLKPERDTQYLILNITFKNTDTESRMIEDGEVLIAYNGKNYRYDHSETIVADGWGLFFDQINPLTSKTTNLVYKIPSELKGTIYYHPGRADSDKIIRVGDID